MHQNMAVAVAQESPHRRDHRCGPVSRSEPHLLFLHQGHQVVNEQQLAFQPVSSRALDLSFTLVVTSPIITSPTRGTLSAKTQSPASNSLASVWSMPRDLNLSVVSLFILFLCMGCRRLSFRSIVRHPECPPVIHVASSEGSVCVLSMMICMPCSQASKICLVQRSGRPLDVPSLSSGSITSVVQCPSIFHGFRNENLFWLTPAALEWCFSLNQHVCMFACTLSHP